LLSGKVKIKRTLTSLDKYKPEKERLNLLELGD